MQSFAGLLGLLCQYLGRVGLPGWFLVLFLLCFVLVCFLYYVFLSTPINLFDLYFFSHSFLFLFFSFEILFKFLFVWEEMSSPVPGPENDRLM